MDMNALRKEAAALLASAEELNNRAKDDGRQPTIEEQAQIDQMEGQATQILDNIEAYNNAQAVIYI